MPSSTKYIKVVINYYNVRKGNSKSFFLFSFCYFPFANSKKLKMLKEKKMFKEKKWKLSRVLVIMKYEYLNLVDALLKLQCSSFVNTRDNWWGEYSDNQ